jgi:hypothetical protein
MVLDTSAHPIVVAGHSNIRHASLSQGWKTMALERVADLREALHI